MNFPTATDADWTDAQAIIRRLLARHGVTGVDADDAAQAWSLEAMVRRYKTPPETPVAAALMACGLVRRRGIACLVRHMANQARRAARRSGLEQPQPSHVFDARPPRAPGWTDPAAMAEAGESLAARMPRYAQRARAQGMTPAALALTAAGWGPLDEDEAAKTVPAVESHGAGYVPPSRGCPGMATATDPNPASREKARRDADAAAERVGLIVSRRA